MPNRCPVEIELFVKPGDQEITSLKIRLVDLLYPHAKVKITECSQDKQDLIGAISVNSPGQREREWALAATTLLNCVGAIVLPAYLAAVRLDCIRDSIPDILPLASEQSVFEVLAVLNSLRTPGTGLHPNLN